MATQIAPTPAANAPKASGLPAVPPVAQQNDTVSQMKSYLSQSGYTPPPATSANGDDWYSKVVQNRQQTQDTSLGGFGKVLGDIGSDFNKRADEISPILNSKDNPASKALQIAGKGADVVNDVAGDVIKSVVKPEILQGIGDAIGHAADSPVVTAIAKSPAVQGIMSWFGGLSPETQNNLKATGSIASLLLNATGGGVAKDAVAPALDIATQAAKVGAEKVIAPVIDAAKAGVKNTASAVIKPVKEAVVAAAPVEKLKAKLGGKNAARGLEASATRLADHAPLIGAGAAREAKPLDIYNTAAEDAATHLSDPTRVDKPTENFGKNEVANAFDQVVKAKRDAGDAMSAELDKPEVGNIKTNVEDARNGIAKELSQQKLEYDSKKGIVSATGQTPIGKTGQSQLESYLKELSGLGNKPTVTDVNNFVRRITEENDLYKQKNQITGTTNVERIIKNNLSALRDTISAKATGNNALKAYSDSKSEVARLSKIVDAGIPLLGKKSLEGGYIRDASTAKRAIQSLSDGGAKDFLRALEKETGNPLLDKAFVILQAEKDAGITSAHSLLDMFGKDSALKVPNSVRGKIMDWALNHTVKGITGSPADQTRAFLKSLEEKK